MEFANIMITPKGDTITEISDTPYQHSVFFSLDCKYGEGMDMQLPNGDFIHSKITGQGEFILILKKLKD